MISSILNGYVVAAAVVAFAVAGPKDIFASENVGDVPVPVARPSGKLDIPVPKPRPQDVSEPVPVMEQTDIDCRDRLKALGALFEEQKPVREEAGCRIDNPILVRRLRAGIAIVPPALLNCPMAEAIATFSGDVANPLAIAAFGSGLRSVRHNSAYVCRRRAGSGKLSEHAFGNALDIASFELENGRTIDVKHWEGGEDADAAAFQKAFRSAACGPFKTVLGPGSDDDHAHHIHLDLAQRRNGSTYCR